MRRHEPDTVPIMMGRPVLTRSEIDFQRKEMAVNLWKEVGRNVIGK